jgi:hypothetical protein
MRTTCLYNDGNIFTVQEQALAFKKKMPSISTYEHLLKNLPIVDQSTIKKIKMFALLYSSYLKLPSSVRNLFDLITSSEREVCSSEDAFNQYLYISSVIEKIVH